MSSLSVVFTRLGAYFVACSRAGWDPQPRYLNHRLAGMRLAGLPYNRAWHSAALASALDGGAAC